MEKRHNFIVVGSGPSAAMAAQTLVEAEVDTAMIDAGFYDDFYEAQIPEKNFLDIRSSDANQHTYFLGKEFEGINFNRISTGPQLTPPRRFINEGVNKWLPFVSDNFSPLETLAYGGLGSAWGLNCFTFSGPEIKATGLNESLLPGAYQKIADRIGISGAEDDASPYCNAGLKNLQPAVKIEKSLNRIFLSYEKQRNSLNQKGFYAGRTALALLTQDKNGRKNTSYSDMDFWSNPGKSAYRPAITIDELKKKPNFKYYDKCLILKFSENDLGVKVTLQRIDNGQKETFFCRTLILAAGTFGTSRIVIRSFDYKKNALPVLCNTYCYLTCLQPWMLGRNLDDKKISYSQLSLFYDPKNNNFDVATVLFYTYRSLLLFRLAKELPFNFADNIRLLTSLYPALVIAGLHHPEKYSPQKYIQLLKDDSSPTGDKLIAHYKLNPHEKFENNERERLIKKALRKIGCYPIRRIDPGHGSSIHYGGTLPFSQTGDLFTTSPSGKLHGTKNVYIADGSGFRYLPSKGPTLTLMANAHLTALNSLNNT